MNESNAENLENAVPPQSSTADAQPPIDAGDAATPSPAPLAADDATLSDAAAALAAAADSPAPASGSGPLAGRPSGPLARRSPGHQPSSPPPSAGRPGSPLPVPQRPKKPAAPAAEGAATETGGEAAKPEKPKHVGKEKHPPRGKQIAPPPTPRIMVPSKRAPLSDDLEEMLARELAGSGLEEILGGQAGMPMRDALVEGQRVQAKVIKKNVDAVFVSLGGPDEGAVAFEQFKEEPEIGASVEVIVRGFNNDDGMYMLALPGQALDASDWDELEEGDVVEAYVESVCNGGVDVKVGSLRGFIPISQLSEFRIEDAAEFVDKKLMCVVNECNPRRKNLVLSHRAILEREREERRQEQMAKIAVGDVLEGTVRNVLDFGAFVDLGGVEGLIHISKLSWDRIKHPSEVIETGQKVKVRIDKIDEATGKIGLSYRDLLEQPWDNIDSNFPVGSTVTGTVTRTADFGAFVRLGTGIEGLIHISELAHHRVFKVDNVVKVDDVIEVKILSVDKDSQRIGLSLKATQVKPQTEEEKAKEAAEAIDEPAPEPYIKKRHVGPLKGGKDADAGGAKFGLKW
ncbi:30S ribosomal protein S1 [Rosistilla carotiformis]|uniref:30S ribosomal protein S1 n=1 Tax=Rosistilla carotiformis TaxID=2528017 RepID=A0A518JSS4_9BACT|nr:S1 RNA-binding domain-containing protein [Rosistilla carotiformis]QDV68585.1 30S ribosomal protein S1 [Rosistilla carotiformis]